MTYDYLYGNVEFSFCVTDDKKVFIKKLGLKDAEVKTSNESVNKGSVCKVNVPGSKSQAFRHASVVGAS